jgi:hypothetical protein
MSDEREPREAYPEFLGPDENPRLIRVVRDLRALGALSGPPRQAEAAIRSALVREAGNRRPAAEAQPADVPARRAWPGWWPWSPSSRGAVLSAAAGMAGFAALVAAIALGLTLLLPRAREAQLASDAARPRTINERMLAELRRVQPDVPFPIGAITADLSRYGDVRVSAHEVKKYMGPTPPEVHPEVSVWLYSRPMRPPPAAPPRDPSPSDRGPDTHQDAPDPAMTYIQFSFPHARSARERWSDLEDYRGKWREWGRPVSIRGATGRLTSSEAQGGYRHNVLWWDDAVFHQLSADDLSPAQLLRVARSIRPLDP